MDNLKPVSIFVPGEPQGQGRPRVGSVAGQARMFTPAKTLAYEGVIAFAAQQAMDGRALIAGPVLLEMHMLHPIRDSWSKKKKAGALAGEIAPTIKCDADNCLKAVCDALNNIVWKDDVQVVNVSLSKRFAETPGVRVRIVPLTMLPA